MNTFVTSDGVRIAYNVDDYTDPWRRPHTVFLLHSAMSSARRMYALVPHFEWYLDSAEGVTPEFLSRFVPLMASEYYPERLSAFNFPVLMVVPDPDPMVERAEYELMREHLPNCRFVTIPGAAHSMVSEIPDRCADELRQFLGAIPNA